MSEKVKVNISLNGIAALLSAATVAISEYKKAKESGEAGDTVEIDLEKQLPEQIEDVYQRRKAERLLQLISEVSEDGEGG